VDNNSTDSTKKIIQSLQEKNTKIHYIFAEKRCPASARNKGIEAASGDIFIFIDSDCIAPPNWIEELTLPLRIDNENVAVGFENDLLNNYWTRNIQKMDHAYMQRCSDGQYIRVFDGKNSAIKAVLMKKLMFDENFKILDDLDLTIRINPRAKIRYLPQVKVGHFHRNSFKSTIRMFFMRGFWAFRIYKKYKKNSVNEVIFESMHIKNLAFFPFWAILQFVKKPFSEACFVLMAELSWRAGILWSILDKNK